MKVRKIKTARLRRSVVRKLGHSAYLLDGVTDSKLERMERDANNLLMASRLAVKVAWPRFHTESIEEYCQKWGCTIDDICREVFPEDYP